MATRKLGNKASNEKVTTSRKTSTTKKVSVAKKTTVAKRPLLRKPTHEELMSGGKGLSNEAKQVVEDFLANNPDARLFLDLAKK
jgi:hypothetical protein